MKTSASLDRALLFSRNVEYFLRSAQAGSLKTASRQVGLTQSSLSVAIQNLEEEIGIVLFERSRRGVTLTSRGRVFYDKLLLAKESLLRDLQGALNESSVLPLKIGARPAFLEKYLWPVMRERTLENIPVRCFVRRSLELYRAVQDKRLDCAFVGWPSEPAGDLAVQFVKREPGAWIAHRQRFRHLKRATSLQDLAGEPVIHDPYGEEPDWASQLDLYGSGYSVPDLGTLKAMILAGEGVSDTEPDLFTRQEMKTLMILNIKPLFAAGSTYLVYRKDTWIRIAPQMEPLLAQIHARIRTHQISFRELDSRDSER